MNNMLLTPAETDSALNAALVEPEDYPKLCDVLCKEQHKKTVNAIIKEIGTYYAPHSGMITFNMEVWSTIKERWLKDCEY